MRRSDPDRARSLEDERARALELDAPIDDALHAQELADRAFERGDRPDLYPGARPCPTPPR